MQLRRVDESTVHVPDYSAFGCHSFLREAEAQDMDETGFGKLCGRIRAQWCRRPTPHLTSVPRGESGRGEGSRRAACTTCMGDLISFCRSCSELWRLSCAPRTARWQSPACGS